MSTGKTVSAIALLFLGCAMCSMVWAQPDTARAEKKPLRIGTFDSRAVTVAYANTEEFNKTVRQLKEEYDKAKAEGNKAKMDELQAKGQAGQDKLHRQGFSTAPITDILANIKDQLPEIAKQAGVDVIVSKWDVVYQAPDAEIVDVTSAMIKPFHPSEKTLKTVEEMKKVAPIPLDEMKNFKD